MDALSLITRPLPQTPSPSQGAARAAKPSASSGKTDDAPVFAPRERAPQATTDRPSATTDRPSAAKETQAAAAEENKPTAAPDETAAQPAAPQDPAAAAEQAATIDANAAALLIALAAAAPTTPVATPVIAPIVVALPQQTTTGTKKLDAATAIEPVSSKPIASATSATSAASASPATPTNPAAAAAAQAQPATQAAAQAEASSFPGAAEPAGTAGPATAQQAAADGATPAPGKPNALNALLEGAKPQTAASSASQPQSPTAAQPSAATQVAQLATSDSAANALASDQSEIEAPAPLRAAADAPAAPAVGFGTDPGASAHVKTTTAAYEAARATTPILPASEQVAMQIHRAIDDGVDKVTVELKPAALGRVSAEIQFHDDQRVHVVLSADRPATLDALRSNSRALERALQDAGLRADAGSLSFRFENGGQQGFKPDGSADGIARPIASATHDAAPLAPTAYAGFARPGGVDISV